MDTAFSKIASFFTFIVRRRENKDRRDVSRWEEQNEEFFIFLRRKSFDGLGFFTKFEIFLIDELEKPLNTRIDG